jgi:hypothetical protein
MMLLWNGLETWNRLELRDTRVDHYAQPICFIQPSTQIRVCTKTIHRHKERNPYVKLLNREDLRLLIFLKDSGEFIASSGLHRINWGSSKSVYRGPFLLA